MGTRECRWMATLLGIIWCQGVFALTDDWEMESAVGVVAGAHFNPVHKVITYSSSVPINFKTFWPTKLEKIDVATLDTCQNNSLDPFCHVKVALENMWYSTDGLLDKINEASGEELIATQENVRVKRGLKFLGEFAQWCCDVATLNNVDSLFQNEKMIKDKLEQVESQIFAEHEELASVSNQVNNVNQIMSNLLKKIDFKVRNITNFLKSYEKVLAEQTTKETQSLAELFKSQMITATLVSKHVHTLVRIEILDQCRSGKIPAVLLTPTELTLKLTQLENVLKSDGFRLAVSVENVQVYFHLKICKCEIFGNQLFVQVKVPIVQEVSDWRLFEFVPVPFKWQNSTCSLNQDTTFLVVDGMHITSLQGRALQDCMPYEESLCFIPRYSGDSVIGSLCPKAAFEGETAETLAQLCAFKCQIGTHLVVTEVGPERYFVTNAVGNLTLDCGQNDKKTKVISESHTGALDLSVPCDCSLLLNQKVIITKMYPCDGNAKRKFDIVNVIPAAWSKVKKLHINPHSDSKQTIFPSLSDCLELDWPLQVPHLNITVGKHFEQVTPVKLSDPVDVVSFVSKNLSLMVLYVVVIILTVVIFKNPFLLGFGSFPSVNALGNETVTVLEIVSLTIVVCVLCFMCLLTAWKCWFHKRKPRRVSKSVDVVSATVEEGPSADPVITFLRQKGHIKVSFRDDQGTRHSASLVLE